MNLPLISKAILLLTLLSDMTLCRAEAISPPAMIERCRVQAGFDKRGNWLPEHPPAQNAARTCELAQKQFPVSAAIAAYLARAHLALKRYPESRTLLEQAAQKNSSAQGLLGMLYENGYGVDKDPAQAEAWYRKAALSGLASAQNNLAVLLTYAATKDDPENDPAPLQDSDNQARKKASDDVYQQAASWFERAAKQHNLYAQLNLAYMYREGLGVPRDFARAETLFQASLAARAKTFGKAHPELAKALIGLALVNISRTNDVTDAQAILYYQQAEQYLLRALALQQNALGAEHPAVALTLNRLARLYYDQSLYGKAEVIYLKLQTLLEKIYGKDSDNLAEALTRLKYIHMQQGLLDSNPYELGFKKNDDKYEAILRAGTDIFVQDSMHILQAQTLEMMPLPAHVQRDAGLGAGQVFQDCPECPSMVVIAAGSFMMGSAEIESGHKASESPQHRVTLAHSYAIGEFEVTQDEYARFCNATQRKNCASYTPRSNHCPRCGQFILYREAVRGISWDDAQAYVQWLSRKTGKRYRLPSEAEWEYAARGGTATSYYWGDEAGKGHANFSPAHYPAIGKYPPNAFGLYDMLGNVWEWMADDFHWSYEGAPTDGSVWRGGQSKVIRGGGSESHAHEARSAARLWDVPGGRMQSLGFRVVRELP